MTNDNPLRLAVALNGYGLTEPRGGREVLPWLDLLELVETAEETGYEAVFTPEIGAREAFTALAGCAARTDHITLATGVVPTRSRGLRPMAMAAATLNDLCGGRFVLGLGSLDPIERTRRYVSAVRELLAGGKPRADDRHDGVIDPIDLVPEEHVPIFLAALGPRMTELAGEVADGVILNWCTPDRVARAREEISRGAERTGRDPGGVLVSVFVRTCLGHDEEHALAALRETAATYARMPKYLRQLEAMGLGEEARAAVGGPVPAALVDELTVRGGRDEARARLATYRDAGADLVVVYPVPAQDAATSLLGTVLAAAPHPAVER